jgi:Protein of unknown function (DUF1524)/Excalibur calcium-binding domain
MPAQRDAEVASRLRTRGSWLTVALAVACLGVAACDPTSSPTVLPARSTAQPSNSLTPLAAKSSTSAKSAAPAKSKASTTAGSALSVLAQLSVKGRAPLTGYARLQFGKAWYDANGNGCDTRDDVLRRDLTATTSAGCEILSGTIRDPYTGTIISFERGGSEARELDIDHVVPLGDAWQTGAALWSFDKRVAFANDPTNLLAVDPHNNRQKGDADAASWLPPDKAYRCAYVARQVAVKAGYGLWVTPAEKTAMARVLSTCPNEGLPGKVHVTLVGNPTLPTVTLPSTSSSAAQGLDPRFSTCKEAKAHGYGPYVRGKDPEYAWYRDADSDGVDCE